jgi:SPP1 gp7 family putative phage head morphogenesis protein
MLTANKVLRRDPTRTTLLRRQFIGQMNRRFTKLYKAIKKWLVEEDSLGLNPRDKLKLLQARQYEFLTNPQKLDTFKRWLQQQIDANILTTDGPAGAPWTGKYVESAYRKGLLRAYTDTNAEVLAQSPEWYAGSKAQFLQTAFAQPEVLSKIELVSTRAFEQLRGVTATVAQQLNRALAQGLSNGWGPLKIARDMQKSIGSLTRTRARMIARTETIYAHAEGQLDAFDLLGVQEVGVVAEWSTAGDELVCPQCADMEGDTFTIKEARGLIPLHPNCRCTWIPSEPERKRNVR